MNHPRLTSTLPGRLTDVFNSMKGLQRMTITSPSAIDSLPHPTSLRCLELLDLPPYSEDWQWMASMEGLERVEVSIINPDIGLSSSGSVSLEEYLHIYGTQVKSRIMSLGGTGSILNNLPKDMLVKVSISVISWSFQVVHDCNGTSKSSYWSMHVCPVLYTWITLETKC